MRNFLHVFFLAACLCLAAFPSVVTPAVAAGAVGIFGHAGYGTYAMSDLNDTIATINEQLAAAGIQMDEISGGLDVGGGLRLHLSPALDLSAGYERLFASTDVGINVQGTEIKQEFQVPANAITGTAELYLPSSGPVRFGVGAGLGYYLASGTSKLTVTGEPEVSEDVKGHGFGFHGLALLDVPATESIHLSAAAGFRYARTTNVEVGGEEQRNEDGSKSTLDYSGLMTRAGVTVYFSPSR